MYAGWRHKQREMNVCLSVKTVNMLCPNHQQNWINVRVNKAERPPAISSSGLIRDSTTPHKDLKGIFCA